MTLGTDTCRFRMISEEGRALMEGDDSDLLVAFTRRVLSCPRLRECDDGAYCTIFAASLLTEWGKEDIGDDHA